MSIKFLAFAVVSAVLATNVSAQDCDPSKSESAPEKNFRPDHDGTVTDKSTKKTWMRCALGSHWKDGHCAGQSLTYTLNDALTEINALNESRFGDHKKWRLPTQEELASLVEQRCYKPAINLAVFPEAPVSGFWTKTLASDSKERAWIVHFLHGGQYLSNKKQLWRVRPVSD